MKIYASRKHYTYKDFIGKDVWVLMEDNPVGKEYIRILSIDYESDRLRFNSVKLYNITDRAGTYSFYDGITNCSISYFEKYYTLVEPLDILEGDEMIESLGLSDEE